MKSNNQAKLANLFQTRMTETVNKRYNVPPLELGVIQGDMSLKTDGLPESLDTYMVARQLTLGAKDEVLTKTKEDGKHIHNEPSIGSALEKDSEHEHEVLIPEKMRKLKPGDRVLVSWINSSIPVVIDIVYDKSEM